MQIEKLTLSVMDTNVYLVDIDDLIVIDPADDVDVIKEAAARIGKPIKYALLTHGHFDHCNAVAQLQREGTKVFMSKTDFDMIQNGFDLAKYCGIHFNAFTPDGFIDEGELCLEDKKINVIATPGHTAGSLTFIIDNVIFSGDTLFFMSVGRADLPSGDKRQLTQSIKRLYALDGDYLVYPGHGRNTTLNFERENNPYVKA